MTVIGNSSADVLERHTHAHPYFCFVIDGEIGERTGGRSRQSPAGSLLFHAQGVRHTNDFGSHGAVRLNLEITSGGATFDAALRDAMAASRDLSRSGAAALAVPLERAFYNRDVATAQSILRELLHALGSVQEGRDGEPPWLEYASARVRSDFRSTWSLNEIARQAGVNPSHLAREYRRHHGQTVGQHVRQLRIEYAIAALLEPDVSLAEVALSAGFADQSHFSRAFRRHMGVTPSGFRNRRSESHSTTSGEATSQLH